ncbi:hypothetical protein [Floridanema aerugineum]|uniref:Thioredoxin domain-containing protein n=1 Tax=Floridaenema aerugineum BLCC-F46 TaxID=3153654 RepID=A0ABV4XCG3_9CYAN
MKSISIIQFVKISLPTAIFASLALISSCSSTNNSQKVEAQTAPTPTQTVSATTKSTPTKKPANSNVVSEVALANHLKQKGAKMYSTFWCTTCNWQERQFGTQATQVIKASVRVECDPRGKNPQTELCDKIDIRILPTWQINGKLYEGAMPLRELADISGYSGPRNFKTSGN